MKNRQDDRTRICLAQEAARIIQNEGVKDYQHAKLKAADRMNIGNNAQLPRNSEIESALKDHQTIFHSQEHEQLQQRYLQMAQRAMQMLKEFSPRLVGSVLEGTANRHSNVNLHVFADSSEEILLVLMDVDIPYQSCERRFRFSRVYQVMPCIQFFADNVEIDVAIFPTKGLRQAPLSMIDGKPMSRADAGKVEALLNTRQADEVKD